MKNAFSIIVSKEEIRVIPYKKDRVIAFKNGEVVLHNPDLSAVRGLHPHQWQHVDGKIVPRNSPPAMTSAPKVAFKFMIALGVVAVIVFHLALLYFSL